ncbi:uncharacterized protein TM35_000123000 [Trypanosoma theileri]|uniref:Uncharacterized protein n=1 Tax=Trypanosoma theileri TaxID=67003 RepID=A0A1X0NXW8_9TRYP|nr:uncharacterized protein TM35_000123000 [Trypanosoma theileri]ORC89525.1 hypothetical protein TM35_000123000 [Trypanosoma theileri]
MVEGNALGPTTDVTVHVAGTFTLPLHQQALETLEDPLLQSEIMQEAVRLAIAEKLGGFDNVNITTTHKGGKPIFEAHLQLADLCSAIANVQYAYKHAMTQMLRMQEMITETLQHDQEDEDKKKDEVKEEKGEGSEEISKVMSEKNSEVLSKLVKMLEDTLEGPGESSLSAAIRTRMHSNNDDDNDNSMGNLDEDNCEEYRDPEDEGYIPLLDDQESEPDNEDNDEDDNNDNNKEGDNDNNSNICS